VAEESVVAPDLRRLVELPGTRHGAHRPVDRHGRQPRRIARIAPARPPRTSTSRPSKTVSSTTWRSRRGSTAQPSVGTTTWPVYLVTVISAGGKIEVPVEVTGEIMPGVVSMPHGWGHGKPGTRMAIANESPGVNTNILSPPTFIDEPSGNGALNAIPVTVTAART